MAPPEPQCLVHEIYLPHRQLLPPHLEVHLHLEDHDADGGSAQTERPDSFVKQPSGVVPQLTAEVATHA